MNNLIKLLFSAMKRVTTAMTSPFRMMLVSIQRLFNINVITAKLISPLTRKIKELLAIRPKNKDDYHTIGGFLVYKKIFYTVILVMCAGVFIYFSIYAQPIPTQYQDSAEAITTIFYDYDDIKLSEFSGVANIRAADGKVIYIGDVDLGVITGSGRLYSRDGQLVYSGDFEDNLYSGDGVKYYSDGSILYEGEFASNLYNGAGKLYDISGDVVYEGSFKDGQYQGDGAVFMDNKLIYEGTFSKGDYHGNGTLYHLNGNVNYEGEFYSGQPQGQGTLYNNSGKALYTGMMYQGEINYESLLGATLEEIDASFYETPKIYYDENDSCFVYEQAGVIISSDSRVMVDVWEKEQDVSNTGEGYYFLPGQYDYDTYTQEDTLPDIGDEDTLIEPDIFEEDLLIEPDSDDPLVNTSPEVQPLIAEEPPAYNDGATYINLIGTGESPMEVAYKNHFGDIEIVLDKEDNPYIKSMTLSGGSSSDNEELQQYLDDLTEQLEEEQEKADQERQEYLDELEKIREENTKAQEEALKAQEEEQEEAAAAAQAAIEAAEAASQPDIPDFVDKEITLYFEIDRDIWQSEDELDKTKVFIEKVTVMSGGNPLELGDNAVSFDVDLPPSIEDCVSIDFIRQSMPTAFSNIAFEMDRENKLFIQINKINNAERIVQKSYQVDGLTYTYNYQLSDKNSIMYYSIER